MRQRRLKNEINVVPYIDVMLVLLVIFMVATPMMTTGSVNLPTSGTAPQKPDKYLKVQVEQDGALTVFDTDGKPTKVKGLKNAQGHPAGRSGATTTRRRRYWWRATRKRTVQERDRGARRGEETAFRTGSAWKPAASKR